MLKKLYAKTWPASAAIVWMAAWLVCQSATSFWGSMTGILCGIAVASALSLPFEQKWRKACGVIGFTMIWVGTNTTAINLSVIGAISAGCFVTLVLMYPPNLWADAPMFPTPSGALSGLGQRLHSGIDNILDAGCGSGNGLHELRKQFPHANITGVEASSLLAKLARTKTQDKCTIVEQDMWAHNWKDYDLVYAFHSPDTMQKAWDKARQEMKVSSWFVSLNFPIPDQAADLIMHNEGCPPFFAYQIKG